MSKIQWTDKTVNPITVVTGGHWCSKISPGCDNCFSEDINLGNRFDFASGLPYAGPPPPLVFNYAIPESWARMRTAKKIFVCSMTDLFGYWVKREWQFAIFDGAAAAPRQTIQILTKRPRELLCAALEWCSARDRDELPPNLWVGVSVEDRKTVDSRLPVLRRVPARIHFVSAEPLLEAICIPLEGIQWVIVGGESGKNARECSLNNIRLVVRDCIIENIPVFVKQVGSKPTGFTTLPPYRTGKGGSPEILNFFGLNIQQFPAV